jgi:NAD(P)H-hydrate epimerase
MLGTGVEGRVREPVASAIRWTNRQRCPVVAMDIPSGLSSDTGLPCGAAVRATETVTCGLPNIGLTQGRGKRFSGRVRVADISVPRVLTV